MAKRKRSTNIQKGPGKKAKVPHPHGAFDPDREYKLRSIVGEDKTRYLISWEDDEVTGEVFEDTWEPKRNANRQAIEDWEKQKSDKKRIERLSGTLSKSRSNSVATTSSTGSPRKPTTSSRQKARQRRVVESSPQPEEERFANGHPSEEQLQRDELIEISESEVDDAEARSPLFEPQQEPHRQRPKQPSLAVHLSPAPSSYFAGGYQAISSSEPESDRPSPTKDSGEPSQYVPDPADTSKTSEDTTEISLGPSTPSEQPRLVPVNFCESSTNIVPDSQSGPGSSSHLPSINGVINSLSAPETGQRADRANIHHPEDPAVFTTSPIPASSAPQQETSIADLQLSASAPGEHVNVPADTNGPVPTDEVPETVQATATRSGDEQRALTRDTESSHQEARPDEGTDIERGRTQSQTAPSPSAGGFDRPVPVPEPHIPAATSQLNSATVLSSSNIRSPRDKLLRRASRIVHEEEQRPEPEVTESRFAQVESHQNGELSRKLPNGVHSAVDQLQVSNAVQSNSAPVRVRRPETATGNTRIDLTTTQEQPTSISRFSVTPPERGQLRFGLGGRRHSPQVPDSSAWQSSFPFQTQLSRPLTSDTSHHNTSATGVRNQALSENHVALRQVSEFSPRASSLPLGASSPLFTSSPIPRVPSQSVDINTFGESAPRPPLALSSPFNSPRTNRTMDPSQSMSESGKEVLARITAMRELKRSGLSEAPTSSKPLNTPEAQQSNAPKLASPFLSAYDRTRSPSAVPAVQPLATITKEEMNTSRRCETLLPQSQDQSSNEDPQNAPLASNSNPVREATLNSDGESVKVYAVPIYFIGHQRDQYPQMVYFHKDLVNRFLASKSPDDKLTSEIRRFVDRVRSITLHPDLDNAETFTQYDVEPSQQARWDVNCSTKFRFLKVLFDGLRDSKLHVAILAQSGRLIDILETFLQGIEVSYIRFNGAKSDRQHEGRGTLRVSLQDSEETQAPSEPADLVIAMDNSVKHSSEKVRSLRQSKRGWSPLIILVVPHSVEHVERCLSPTLSERARMRALVSGVHRFRNEAGKAQDGQEAPKSTALDLARYLLGAEDGPEWPLPALSNLEDLDSQTDSEVDIIVSNADSSNLAVVGEKRSREHDDSDDVHVADSNKRSRVESPAEDEQVSSLSHTVNPQEIDITHISDSIGKGTQSHITDAETGSPVLNATEKRLQHLLQETQDRLEEHVKVLSDLQYRHEEQRTKLIEVTRERDAAIATAQNAVARYTEESNRMSNMKTEITALKDQLKEANTRLLDHSVPERVELETIRLAAEQAKADRETLERRLKQAKEETAFVRERYQESSDSAQSFAAQVSDLENRLAVAENKATGEQAKVRSLSNDVYAKNLHEENKKLKAMLKERETGLKFRDEEIAKLKEASRGRMGTRGTSVPRSPRIGSPRIGSRQTSPATGELRGRSGLLHPLRNV